MKKIYRNLVAVACIGLVLSACVRPSRSETTPTVAGTESVNSPTLNTSTPASVMQTPPSDVIVTPNHMERVITAGNVSNLAGSETIQEPGAQVFTWIAGDEALAVGTDQEVALFTTSPKLKVASIPASQTGMLSASTSEARLAWAGDDQAIHVWDIDQASEVATLSIGEGEVTSLVLSPSGNILAAATFDNSLTLWDANTGQIIHNWVMPAFFTNLSFAPDETRLAGIAPQTFSSHIIDIDSQEEIQTLTWTDHASPVLYSAHFSPDWQKIAWVARGTVQLMDVETEVMGLALQHEDAVTDLSWSPDGSLIAVLAAATVEGNFVPTIILWQTSTGASVRVIPLDRPASQIEFSPSGKELAILDSQGKMSLWMISPQ